MPYTNKNNNKDGIKSNFRSKPNKKKSGIFHSPKPYSLKDIGSGLKPIDYSLLGITKPQLGKLPLYLNSKNKLTGLPLKSETLGYLDNTFADDYTKSLKGFSLRNNQVRAELTQLMYYLPLIYTTAPSVTTPVWYSTAYADGKIAAGNALLRYLSNNAYRLNLITVDYDENDKDKHLVPDPAGLRQILPAPISFMCDYQIVLQNVARAIVSLLNFKDNYSELRNLYANTPLQEVIDYNHYFLFGNSEFISALNIATDTLKTEYFDNNFFTNFVIKTGFMHITSNDYRGVVYASNVKTKIFNDGQTIDETYNYTYKPYGSSTPVLIPDIFDYSILTNFLNGAWFVTKVTELDSLTALFYNLKSSLANCFEIVQNACIFLASRDLISWSPFNMPKMNPFNNRSLLLEEYVRLKNYKNISVVTGTSTTNSGGTNYIKVPTSLYKYGTMPATRSSKEGFIYNDHKFTKTDSTKLYAQSAGIIQTQSIDIFDNSTASTTFSGDTGVLTRVLDLQGTSGDVSLTAPRVLERLNIFLNGTGFSLRRTGYHDFAMQTVE